MAQLVNILVTIALIELMVAIGLGVPLADVMGVALNARLVIRAALANYVLVPAVTVGLLLAFRADPMVSAGLLIAAVCPGAPYGPPLTALAKGDVPISVGLMVILAGSSAVLAPLLLSLLMPLLCGSEAAGVDMAQMVFTLLAVQIAPLCVGLLTRQFRPDLAARLLKPANRLSAVLNLAVIGLILAVHFQTLAEIRARGFVGMFALVVAALAAGWALGGRCVGGRRSMAITTSVRNVGVGLVIATSSFPGTAAVTATLAFALFQTIVLAVVALVWGRAVPATPAKVQP